MLETNLRKVPQGVFEISSSQKWNVIWPLWPLTAKTASTIKRLHWYNSIFWSLSGICMRNRPNKMLFFEKFTPTNGDLCYVIVQCRYRLCAPGARDAQPYSSSLDSKWTFAQKLKKFLKKHSWDGKSTWNHKAPQPWLFQNTFLKKTKTKQQQRTRSICDTKSPGLKLCSGF